MNFTCEASVLLSGTIIRPTKVEWHKYRLEKRDKKIREKGKKKENKYIKKNMYLAIYTYKYRQFKIVKKSQPTKHNRGN